MAIVFTPQPTQNGLAALGDYIAQGGQQYLALTGENALREQARMQQLADEERARAYALGDYQRMRTDAQSDYQRARTDKNADTIADRAYAAELRKKALTEDVARSLIETGYLKLEDLDKTNAAELISAANERSRNDGLLLQELAAMRQVVSESPDISGEDKAKLLSLDPRNATAENLEFARKTYAMAQQKAGDRTNMLFDQKQDSIKGGQEAIVALENERAELMRVMADANKPVSPRDVEMNLQAKFGADGYASLLSDPKRIDAEKSAAAREIADAKAMAAYNAQRQLQTWDERMIATQRSASAGVLLPRNKAGAPAAITGGAPAAAAPAPASTGTKEDAANRALGISGPGAETAAPARGQGGTTVVPKPQAGPAALGGVPVPRIRSSADFGSPFSDANATDPDRGVMSFVGALGKDAAYNVMAAAQKGFNRYNEANDKRKAERARRALGQ